MKTNIVRFIKSVGLTSDIRAFKGLDTDTQLYLLKKMNKKELQKYFRYAKASAKFKYVQEMKKKKGE